ncbi:MAG: short-chain dehydrogenase/reductase [Acidimicrobiales bacterium]|nr:short-chain dehydrogenase/reductase [Acidimicrobiales bacterium]
MTTNGRLHDTVALVTGASSGIGAATARSLAAEGATVVVAARRKDRLDDLVASIGADGGTAVAVESDVTSRDHAVALVDGVVADHGRLDIVINNAGVMLNGPIEDAPVDEWERMVDLNIKGLLYVAHTALPHLLRAAEAEPRRVADLVNISSVAGRLARLGSGVYNLTKHGVGAFSESLRQEVTERHVRVALVEPGAVATELATHMRPEILATMAKRFEGKEILTAEDIAESITFVVTRPRRMAVNEILIRPTEQQA